MNSHKSNKNNSISQNAKIKLNNTQTSNLPYPNGSFLWYNKKWSHGNLILSGTAKSISMDVNTRTICYEIERCLEYASKPSTIDSDIIPEEDIICFGAGFPVRVKTNHALPTMEHQELKGKILSGKKSNGSVTYTVMLFPQGCENCFKIEENVAHDRVKLQLQSIVANEDLHDHVSLQDTVQASNTHEYKTIKVHEVACKYDSEEETLSSSKSNDSCIGTPVAEDVPLSNNGQNTPTIARDRRSSSSTLSGQKRSLSPSPFGLTRTVTQDRSASPDQGPVSKKLKTSQPMSGIGKVKHSSSESKRETPQRVSIPAWLLKDKQSRMKLHGKQKV